MSNTIYTHKHHIIPRHAGGTDDPSNLIELTVEEHAEAHKKLYEEYGRWQDKLAWQGLAGRIGKEEIIRTIQSMANTGRIHSPKARANMSKGQMGKKYTAAANKAKSIRSMGSGNSFYGKKHSDEARFKMSKAAEGRTVSVETRKKLSLATKGIPKPRIECPHCNKVGGLPQMKRHHFNNCKENNNG